MDTNVSTSFPLVTRSCLSLFSQLAHLSFGRHQELKEPSMLTMFIVNVKVALKKAWNGRGTVIPCSDQILIFQAMEVHDGISLLFQFASSWLPVN